MIFCVADGAGAGGGNRVVQDAARRVGGLDLSREHLPEIGCSRVVESAQLTAGLDVEGLQGCVHEFKNCKRPFGCFPISTMFALKLLSTVVNIVALKQHACMPSVCTVVAHVID